MNYKRRYELLQKRHKQVKQRYKLLSQSIESKEFRFNSMCEWFYDRKFNCNVVWMSNDFKRDVNAWMVNGPIIRTKKTVDVYCSDFGTTKIFDASKVKWSQLKPKKIIAFIQE